MKCPKVDEDKCIGCGACVAMCPEVFEMNSEGKSIVKKCEGVSEDSIKLAVNSCPVQAIEYDD